MRAIDAAEAMAFGFAPKQALRHSLMVSAQAMTATVDGRPEAMFGVVEASAIEGIGRPWFLGTDRVAACASALLTMGPPLIASMRTRFRRLENLVAVENVRAIRVLKRWGFEVGGDEIMVGGTRFHYFRMTR